MPTITAAEAADAPLVPIEFVARTLHVYTLLLLSPASVIGELGPDVRPGMPPSVEVHATLKLVIARPLLLFGVNDDRDRGVARRHDS